MNKLKRANFWVWFWISMFVVLGIIDELTHFGDQKFFIIIPFWIFQWLCFVCFGLQVMNLYLLDQDNPQGRHWLHYTQKKK